MDNHLLPAGDLTSVVPSLIEDASFPLNLDLFMVDFMSMTITEKVDIILSEPIL